MKKVYCIVLLLVLANVALFALNQMDLMTTLTGEFIGSNYGSSVVSMDFNGDGYDDLIVKSQYWNPTGIYDFNQRFGKIYFYWGGSDFDNIPDYVIEGQFQFQFSSSNTICSMLNAGDMSGDGIDDLLIQQYNPEHSAKLGIYFGRATPQVIPDIEWSEPSGRWMTPFALGDINGDNRDDVSIAFRSYNNHYTYTYIWDDVFGQPYQFRASYQGFAFLVRIGDVNNDGFEDCSLTTNNTVSIGDYRQVLYFGCPSFPLADSLVIDVSSPSRFMGSPAGDCNGDGYDDFVARLRDLWLGSSNLSNISDLTLSFTGCNESFTNFFYTEGIPLTYGDYNGDGFDDFVGSDNTVGYYDGQAALWLGGANMNGIPDLVLHAPQIGSNFGYSKATGDFDGDGLSDLAISAPFWTNGSSAWPEAGKVYVYSGNIGLADTTVGIEDPSIPSPDICQYTLSAYPNPLPLNVDRLTLRISSKTDLKPENFSFEVYNLRGQCLRKIKHPLSGYRSGEFIIDVKGMAAGIYILVAKQHELKKASTKLLIY